MSNGKIRFLQPTDSLRNQFNLELFQPRFQWQPKPDLLKLTRISKIEVSHKGKTENEILDAGRDGVKFTINAQD